jgi:hypothetical protein
VLAPATLAALPSTRAIPNRYVFYVAPPAISIDSLVPTNLICYHYRRDRPSRSFPRLFVEALRVVLAPAEPGGIS